MIQEEAPPGLTVAITGAGGYLAGRLIASLDVDQRISRILGFDNRPWSGAPPAKLVFDQLDVRDPALEARLAGVDVLIHLAFIMDPIKDEATMRDVNVNGSQNVFRCAARAGVERVIYTSSATVYGAHPNNDMPLTEGSPLRANLDLSYAAHKLEVEYVAREVRDEYPNLSFTIFRPAIVFGPNVDNAWSHLLEQPVLFGVAGHSPPMQFVHEDDVAEALRFSVFAPGMDGVFNLAPSDWIGQDEMLAILGKKRIDLPEPLAFQLIDKMWAAGLAEAPAGILHYVMHPWVVAPDELARAGFTCVHTSGETFMRTAEHSRRAVRLGRARVERSKLRNTMLAGAGALGAAALLRNRRRSA